MSLNEIKMKEIEALTPAERLSGYLLVSAKLAVLGSRLRKGGRADRTWTQKENDEWDAIVDEMNPWHYALSESEKEVLSKVDIFIAALTCGEYPPNR
jgi:hypothetical protein